MTCHHIRIHIHGIDGIGDRYHAVLCQQLLKITCVTLGSVADEHLVCFNVDATGAEIVGHNGFTQEVVTAFRTITTERR